MPNKPPVLLGNTFPLSLVRRPVRIAPDCLDTLRSEVEARGVVSFWGHANTLPAARETLGFDPAPATERPAVQLDHDRLPVLDETVFREIWILSPDFVPGFRPSVGEEVPAGQILGWQVLRIEFVVE